ncbi:hypothetical protein EHS25_006415 [Saitozyma podzolica]|uniref:N-acetyltransferase domain-containing protein n=1 Tax=Saitozyma podzolica TaxID=1890683 RepID=A0A427YRS2_9TREE|nr:hypothetical protein EHS25_006415 [Saitozyma podzolica]
MASPSHPSALRLPAPWSEYHIDSSPTRFDVEVAWSYLSTQAYWGRHRSRELVELQIQKAWLVFGLFHEPSSSMVGMARVVGDGDTNLLMDVFVLPAHQGNGLGVAFLEHVLNGEDRKSWRWLMHTGDRKDWYVQKLGFRVVGPGARGKMMGVPYFVLEKDGRVPDDEV